MRLSVTTPLTLFITLFCACLLQAEAERGRILDRNGIVLAETVDGKRRYPLANQTGQLTGYLRIPAIR